MKRTPGDWLSIRQYAEHFGVHRNTVRKWITEGLLVSWKSQHTIRIKRQPPFEKRPGGQQPTT